jgi:hypothetical protein
VSCKDCQPLGPLDPKTVAALVRIMGTPQFASLLTGLSPETHGDGRLHTPRLVVREMRRLRELVSSEDFIRAVLTVLVEEYGRHVRVVVRPPPEPVRKTRKRGLTATGAQ